ncbi:MAG: hypothetical protein HY000_31340, partial [Planctomycetes bacterium]|nr:hypothetical protein [Planctomycetota bacterium]
MRSAIAVWLVLLGVLLSVSAAVAEQAEAESGEPSSAGPSTEGSDSVTTGSRDLLDLDIEQLSRTDVVVPALDTVVTTVARQESTVGRTPAAVFVITQDMIRRSGA